MTAFIMRSWMLTPLALALITCGCQRDDDASAKDNGNSDVAVQKALFEPDARLAQPFLQATIQEVPEGQLCPPKMTVAGKSVGKLFEQIAGKNGVGGLWNEISFNAADGKRLRYTAKVETDLGTITIELWPDVAPNHVRNFIALARAGYYEGLSFDRIVKQRGGGDEAKLELIAGGCPLGTGEPGFGSIGYWLKPEFSDKVTHEAGTIGAWHTEEVESAACKFYITLGKAPFMDGFFTLFGKVTGGMEVARQVLDRPLRQGFDDRPAEPVLIRRVVIETHVQETL